LCVPISESGLPNYFQACVSSEGTREVLSVGLDDLRFPRRIALVKIDVERHEVAVLRGMD
jgi:hypothetical protein